MLAFADKFEKKSRFVRLVLRRFTNDALVIATSAAVALMLLASCSESPDLTATVEREYIAATETETARRATAEVRNASATAISQSKTATREAAPSPTATRYPRARDTSHPTPIPTTRRPTQIDRHLMLDMEDIGLRIEALFPYLQSCVRRGDLDWSRHSTWLEHLALDLESVGNDLLDGMLDHYEITELRTMVSSAHIRLDQLESQCLR